MTCRSGRGFASGGRGHKEPGESRMGRGGERASPCCSLMDLEAARSRSNRSTLLDANGCIRVLAILIDLKGRRARREVNGERPAAGAGSLHREERAVVLGRTDGPDGEAIARA